ncbi:right-handed parallel beta-helix repeat-containing protein [Catenulispora yoronensis]
MGGLAPVTAHAAAASTIYVDNTPGLGCSDTATGAGSRTVPFCSINAAVAVAGPGSRVLVFGQTGDFSPAMNVVGYRLQTPIVPPSGVPGDPVTIEAAVPDLAVHAPGTQPSFLLDNVHDVVIKGFLLDGGTVATGAAGTSRVAFDGDVIADAVHLSGATDSSFTRCVLAQNGVAANPVTVDGGSSGTLFADNIDVAPGQLIFKDAPGAKIVNNTFAGNEVWLGGSSTGSVVENNIISALAVDATAEPGIKADYNHVVHAVDTTNAYFWGGHGYDQADFVAATGQGVHDTGGPFATTQVTRVSGLAGYYMPAMPAPSTPPTRVPRESRTPTRRTTRQPTHRPWRTPAPDQWPTATGARSRMTALGRSTWR